MPAAPTLSAPVAAPLPTASRMRSNPNLLARASQSSQGPLPVNPTELSRGLETAQSERKAVRELRRKSTGQSLGSAAQRTTRAPTDIFDAEALARSIQHQQRRELSRNIQRRSLGDVSAYARQRPKTVEPFEADVLRRKLEAYQRSLARLEASGGADRADAGKDSGVSLGQASPGSGPKSAHLYPNDTRVSRKPSRESITQRPRSSHASSARTPTKQAPELPNVYNTSNIPVSHQTVAAGSNRVPRNIAATRHRSLQPLENPSLSKNRNRRSIPLLNDTTGQQPGTQAPRTSADHAKHAEEEVSEVDPSEIPGVHRRVPNDRPNWSQQDEPDLSRRNPRAHLSLPWNCASAAYSYERDAAIAAENEAARKRHSSYNLRLDVAQSPPLPPPPPRSTSNPTPKPRPSKDELARKSYQDKVKEQRRASRSCLKPPRSGAPSGAASSRASGVSVGEAPAPPPLTPTMAMPTAQSLIPEDRALLMEQERRLKDLQRRQSLASEKYARQMMRGSEKGGGGGVGRQTVDGRSVARSALGDSLEGMTVESVRLLREKEKLLRWRAEREKAQFEQSKGARVRGETVKVPDVEEKEGEGDATKKTKKKRGLCCF